MTAESAAAEAGLHYVNVGSPGLRRVRSGQGYIYRDARGRRVRDVDTLARIRRLTIPPAWTEVWICPDPRGHLQATGRDARGRKQHRYHGDWRETREEAKFARTLAFAKALPRIRARVAKDLAQPGLGREKVLAAMVRLLETTLIRVGNEEYVRQNRSYGLSTLRDRHVSIDRDVIRFNFRGKGGKRHQIDLRDPRLARIVRRAQDLPGQDLFQYCDEHGERHGVTSTDLNAYLREIAGQEFSAKDYRTWAATVLAAVALKECGLASSQREGRRRLAVAIEQVAHRLGNTPAICRKCYIHPAVMEGYLAGSILGDTPGQIKRTPGNELRRHEQAVIRFLRARARQKTRPVRWTLSAAQRRARAGRSRPR